MKTKSATDNQNYVPFAIITAHYFLLRCQQHNTRPVVSALKYIYVDVTHAL